VFALTVLGPKEAEMSSGHRFAVVIQIRNSFRELASLGVSRHELESGHNMARQLRPYFLWSVFAR